jgi:hypothetical protein
MREDLKRASGTLSLIITGNMNEILPSTTPYFER